MTPLPSGRRAVEWRVHDDAPWIAVYFDELEALERDVMMLGNVFVKQNAEGIHERVPPNLAAVPPSRMIP